MPEIDLSEFEGKSGLELENERSAIIARCGSDYDAWNDEDLSRFCAVVTMLRRRASGPPKEVKAPAGKKAAKVKVNVEDLF